MRIAPMIATSLLSLAVEARQPAPVKRYALRELTIVGNVSDTDRKLLVERVRAAVDLLSSTHGVPVEEQKIERVLTDKPKLRECDTSDCNLELGDKVGAERLITVRIARSGASGQRGDWEARLSSFAVDSAKVLATETVPCRGCTADELIGDLAHSLDPMFKKDPFIPLCRLKVASKPPGADVLVDTAKVGQAPFEHTFAAGKHTVAVEQASYAKGETEIDCPPGSGQNMVFTLSTERTSAATRRLSDEPMAPSEDVVTAVPAARDRRPLYRALGGVGTALAVGSLAALAVTAAYHNQNACDGPRCNYRYDATIGITLSAIGTAVFTAGAIAFFTKSFRSRSVRTAWWISPAAEPRQVAIGGGAAF